MHCCDGGKGYGSASTTRALAPWDALLAKNGVASYTAAYALLRAETLFRPYIGANVGAHASYLFS